jgi:hypothetical protein
MFQHVNFGGCTQTTTKASKVGLVCAMNSILLLGVAKKVTMIFA